MKTSPPATIEREAPAAEAAESSSLPETVNKLRRRLVWTSVWGFLATNFLMFLRFFFPRALFEPSPVFRIGYPSDFSLGVDTRFQDQYRIWVVRTTDRLFVIYARCTHLSLIHI